MIKHLFPPKAVFQLSEVEILDCSCESTLQICSSTKCGEVCARVMVEFTNGKTKKHGLLRNVVHTAVKLYNLKHGM